MMDFAKEISNHWRQHRDEIGFVFKMLLPTDQAMHKEQAAKLQARIMACLLMSPFSAESGREMGHQLVDVFKLSGGKLGRFQQLLASQLLNGLCDRQTAWLAPRLVELWSEMSAGFGVALDAQCAASLDGLQQRLMADFEQLGSQAQESAALFEALFKRSYQPICIHQNGRILTINDQVTRQLGYSQEELVGQQVQTLVQAITLPAQHAVILEQIAAGKDSAYRTHCLKKDGTAVLVEVTAQHLAYKGRPVRMVSLRLLDGLSVDDWQPIELTERQKDVLELVAIGLTDVEIGDRLDVQPPTVRYHLALVMEKLQITSRPRAIAWAWQNLMPISRLDNLDSLDN